MGADEEKPQRSTPGPAARWPGGQRRFTARSPAAHLVAWCLGAVLASGCARAPVPVEPGESCGDAPDAGTGRAERGAAPGPKASDEGDFVSRFLASSAECMRGHRTSPPELVAPLVKTYGGDALLAHVDPYLDHESESVRRTMYRWVGSMGLASEDIPFRRKVVDRLAEGIERESRKGSPRGPRPGQQLLKFASPDFSDGAKERLASTLRAQHQAGGGAQFNDTILLAGVAEIRSLLPLLAEIASAEAGRPSRFRWKVKASWCARRARARMGVEEDVAHCIDAVESAPEKLERFSRGFRDLAYVQQSEVVSYLGSYLGRRGYFIPPGWEELAEKRGPPSYGAFAAVALGRMLRGFPLKKNHAGLITREEVETCRKWMAGRKRLEFVRFHRESSSERYAPPREPRSPTPADREALDRIITAAAEALRGKHFVRLGDPGCQL